jgi:hypothetical protein
LARLAGDVEHLDLFDPATLHAKLARYLPKPFEIRAATHHYQGQSYALSASASSSVMEHTQPEKARPLCSGPATSSPAMAPAASGGTSGHRHDQAASSR